MLARQRFEDALKKQGLALESTPVNAASEVSDAALALCQSKIDVFCQLSDGLTNASFPAISRACESTKTPLFSFASGQITSRGDPVGWLRLRRQRPRGGARWPPRSSAARIRPRLRSRLRRRSAARVNLDNARRYSVAIPEEWLEKADVVLPAGPNGRQPAGSKLKDCPWIARSAAPTTLPWS